MQSVPRLDGVACRSAAEMAAEPSQHAFACVLPMTQRAFACSSTGRGQVTRRMGAARAPRGATADWVPSPRTSFGFAETSSCWLISFSPVVRCVPVALRFLPFLLSFLYLSKHTRPVSSVQ
ncbi:hypothetical protein MTO96_002446 [Rhipicephalus appendiculatus]